MSRPAISGPSRFPVSSSSSSGPWSFGPLLQPHYRAFSATMTSADFSPALTGKRSPSKAQNLSLRADRLYLTRLGGLWASSIPADSPPAPGLIAAGCSFGRRFAFRFLQRHLAASALRFGYGCHHRLREVPFNFIDSARVGHTGAALLSRGTVFPTGPKAAPHPIRPKTPAPPPASTVLSGQKTLRGSEDPPHPVPKSDILLTNAHAPRTRLAPPDLPLPPSHRTGQHRP